MAVRHIVTLEEDNPVLRQEADHVTEVDGEIRALIDDMVETMRDAPGIGLAAPQVDVPLRVIVVGLPEDWEVSGAGDLYALCNPEVVEVSEDEEEGEEGCLSIPGYVGFVDRPVRATVRGVDRGGKEIAIQAEGMLARVLQHEVDHTNGVLFLDRLDGPDKLYKIEKAEDEEKLVAAKEQPVL